MSALRGPPFDAPRDMDDSGQPIGCPACGKHDCDGDCPEMEEAMRPDWIVSIDSYTGHPVYSANTARAVAMMKEEEGK